MDITQLYKIALNPSVSPIGFIIFIVSMIVGIIMLLSLVLLFVTKKYKHQNFNMFSMDSWVLLFIGMFLGLAYISTNYEQMTKIKCQSKTLLISLSYTFIIIPIFHQLIVKFQKSSKFIDWIKNHKYCILFLFIAVDLLFNLIMYLSESFTPKVQEIKDGKNFEVCKLANTFGSILLVVLVLEKFIITASVLLFLFMEWNIDEIKVDIKMITSNVYLNVLIGMILLIVCKIDNESYVILFILKSVIILLFVISNYVFTFFLRIFLKLLNNSGEKDRVVSASLVSKNSERCRSTILKSNDKPENPEKTKKSLFKSIMELHNSSNSSIRSSNTYIREQSTIHKQ